jgi:putative lipase involved disintegration of autophagic bodies
LASVALRYLADAFNVLGSVLRIFHELAHLILTQSCETAIASILSMAAWKCRKVKT